MINTYTFTRFMTLSQTFSKVVEQSIILFLSEIMSFSPLSFVAVWTQKNSRKRFKLYVYRRGAGAWCGRAGYEALALQQYNAIISAWSKRPLCAWTTFLLFTFGPIANYLLIVNQSRPWSCIFLHICALHRAHVGRLPVHCTLFWITTHRIHPL